MSAAADALLVTQHYRPELIGPAPFCIDIAEWLLEKKYFVTVLTGPPHYPDPADFPDSPKPSEFANGVLVRRVPSLKPQRRSAGSRIMAEMSFLICGLGALLNRRISRQGLVISLAPSILTVALGVVSRRRGGRHVAIVHDIQSGLARGLGMVGNGLLLRLMRACERTVLNRTDLVIVLTDAMRSELRALGVTVPIEVVSIWVDTKLIMPKADTPLSEDRRSLKICYSGSLGLKQGFGQIMALAEELKAQRPDIELILRGGGGQAQALADEVARRRLDNVRLEGLLPRAQFIRGLTEADIYLVPLEPAAAPFMLPSKIFNIMAAAVPFVATAETGSTLWRLQQESGAFLCVRPNRPDEFTAAVLELAENEELRRQMGQRGRTYVEQYCSKEKVLGSLLDAVDRLNAA